MSVRKKAPRDKIDAADAAYRMFRENRAKGMRIELGQAVSGGNFGQKITNMNLKTKLGSVMAFLAVLLLVIGVMGIRGMGQASDGLRDVYQRHTLGLADVTNINRTMLRNRILTEGSLIDPVPETVTKNFEEMKGNIAFITKTAEDYKARIGDPEEKRIFDRFTVDRAAFVKEGLLATMELLKAGDIEGARTNFFEKTEPLNTKATTHVQALRQYHVEGSKRSFEESVTSYQATRNLAIGVIVAGLLLAAAAAVLLIRVITRPLEQLSRSSTTSARESMATMWTPRATTRSANCCRVWKSCRPNWASMSRRPSGYPTKTCASRSRWTMCQPA